MLCKGGERAAPGTFVVGLGVLVTGLVFGSKILIIAGAGLIGAIVIGFLLDNYLPSARYSPFRVGMYQSAGALAAAGGCGRLAGGRPAAAARPGGQGITIGRAINQSQRVTFSPKSGSMDSAAGQWRPRLPRGARG